MEGQCWRLTNSNKIQEVKLEEGVVLKGEAGGDWLLVWTIAVMWVTGMWLGCRRPVISPASPVLPLPGAKYGGQAGQVLIVG